MGITEFIAFAIYIIVILPLLVAFYEKWFMYMNKKLDRKSYVFLEIVCFSIMIFIIIAGFVKSLF